MKLPSGSPAPRAEGEKAPEGQREVIEGGRVLERAADVGRDVSGNVLLPGRVVEALGKRPRRVVGEEEAFDRRTPVEGVVALADAGQDVVGIGGLGRQARVLGAVDAGAQ